MFQVFISNGTQLLSKFCLYLSNPIKIGEKFEMHGGSILILNLDINFCTDESKVEKLSSVITKRCLFFLTFGPSDRLNMSK